MRIDDVVFSAFCQLAGSVTSGSGFTEEICLNTALTLDLIAANEVLNSNGDNVLTDFDPLYSVEVPDLTPVAPEPEGPGTDTGGGT